MTTRLPPTLALLLMTLVAVGAAGALGQEVTDSMLVEVRGPLADVEIATVEIAIEGPVPVGYQFIVLARAFDSDSARIDAAYFWSSTHPEYVSVRALSDSTAVVTALRKTRDPEGAPLVGTDGEPIRPYVILRATERGEIRIAGMGPQGEFLGLDGFTLQCSMDAEGRCLDPGPHGYACAYYVRDDRLVLQSDLPPRCPILFPPDPSSPRKLQERVVPFQVLAASG